MATFRILRISLAHHVCSRGLSTEAAVATLHPTKVAVRTSESDPTHHKKEDIGKFYSMPLNVREKLFSVNYSLPFYYRRLSDTFQETNIIVRDPALELIDYLKRADYQRPIIRYVLYGRFGCGKTMTLVHTLNYAYNNGFVIVFVPSVWRWYHWGREVVPSERDPTLMDLPMEASKWLKHFETINGELVTQLDLRTTKEYEWNQREKAVVDTPLKEIISFGINRIKYANMVIEALLYELKNHSQNNRCKTFVAIDGYNGFFQTSSRLKTAERVPMIPTNVSLTKNFLSLIQNDWKNGAAVLVVDDHACVKGEFSSSFPFHLLRKVGVESIDPFIPINVPEYTPLEFQNFLDYMVEMRWLQKPDAVDEIAFITQRNPRVTVHYCANR